MGGLARLLVALLLDRRPLAQQGGLLRRRRRRAGASNRERARDRAAGGHGGRVVPRARVRRVLVPRAGVQPRGRACRLRPLVLRRAPPLRPSNGHLHGEVPAARPEAGQGGGRRPVEQAPRASGGHAGARPARVGLPGGAAPRRPLRDPVAQEQGLPIRLVVWRRGSPGVVQRARASVSLPRGRHDRPGVPALRPRLAVEADHREQEGSQGDGGRDRRLLRGHQEAADQRRDLDVAAILARRRPQLTEIVFCICSRPARLHPKFPMYSCGELSAFV